MRKIITLTIIAAAAVLSLSCNGNKEFRPGEVWLDNNGVAINAHGGGILYHDGRYYWFGEHKTEGEGGNRANVGVHCYSSKNLYDWRDEGIALAVDPEGSGSPIEKGCILERPKVIYNEQTGKFVMWFHLELKDRGYAAAMSGVAVSDNITGPYKFLNAGRVNAGKWPLNVSEQTRQAAEAISEGKEAEIPESDRFLVRDFEGGQMARDMTLFVDDDGKAYHIYASEENQTLQIAELTDDYTAHSGRYVRAFVGRSMEAPAIFKHDGKYYMIYSASEYVRAPSLHPAMATAAARHAPEIIILLFMLQYILFYLLLSFGSISEPGASSSCCGIGQTNIGLSAETVMSLPVCCAPDWNFLVNPLCHLLRSLRRKPSI